MVGSTTVFEAGATVPIEWAAGTHPYSEIKHILLELWQHLGLLEMHLCCSDTEQTVKKLCHEELGGLGFWGGFLKAVPENVLFRDPLNSGGVHHLSDRHWSRICLFMNIPNQLYLKKMGIFPVSSLHTWVWPFKGISHWLAFLYSEDHLSASIKGILVYLSSWG